MPPPSCVRVCRSHANYRQWYRHKSFSQSQQIERKPVPFHPLPISQIVQAAFHWSDFELVFIK